MRKKRIAKIGKMWEVDRQDYLNFVKHTNSVRIEDAVIPIGRLHIIKEYQPRSFRLETTSVWSFPERGDWATHKGDYRGNWPPQLARNLILRYSMPGETVLDQMCGGGTTLIECKLLGRDAVGIDINPDAVMLSADRLNFDHRSLDVAPTSSMRLFVGDARNLDRIEDNAIDLIATHPPYAGIIKYSKAEKVEGDLSRCNLEDYLDGMKAVARESFRVLKPGRFCAILVGDSRKRRHYVPIAFRVMQAFLAAGFILREDIIKQQWRLKKSGERWTGLAKNSEESWVGRPKGKGYWTDFFLIYHEHLFVFRKPEKGEKTSEYKASMKWY